MVRERDRATIENKLGNEKFMSRAPEEGVAEQKSRLAEYVEQKEKFSSALASFEGMAG